MQELFIKDYLEKIIFLEKRIGDKTKYQILEPFTLKSNDILEMQFVAKTIAEFIGLTGFVFIVAIAKQREKVGGHIELKYGEKEVFIEIAEEVAEDQASIQSTLAHEITHKYLQINSISCGTGPLNDYENEILTDITAVFLGLGKLMLNGSGVKIEYQKQTENITNKVVTDIGYLNKEQLAFVYRLICAMRKIPSQVMLSGLSMKARASIEFIDKFGWDYFNLQIHNDDYRNNLDKKLNDDINNLQLELEQVNKHLESIKIQYKIYETEHFLETKHKKLVSFQKEVKSLNLGDIFDPCQSYLYFIKHNEQIKRIEKDLEKDINEVQNVINNLIALIKFKQEEKESELCRKSRFTQIFDILFRKKTK